MPWMTAGMLWRTWSAIQMPPVAMSRAPSQILEQVTAVGKGFPWGVVGEGLSRIDVEKSVVVLEVAGQGGLSGPHGAGKDYEGFCHGCRLSLSLGSAEFRLWICAFRLIYGRRGSGPCSPCGIVST